MTPSGVQKKSTHRNTQVKKEAQVSKPFNFIVIKLDIFIVVFMSHFFPHCLLLILFFRVLLLSFYSQNK